MVRLGRGKSVHFQQRNARLIEEKEEEDDYNNNYYYYCHYENSYELVIPPLEQAS